MKKNTPAIPTAASAIKGLIAPKGATKANCTRKHGGFQVLADDNEQVRKGWHLGNTINANENILEQLLNLLVAEI